MISHITTMWANWVFLCYCLNRKNDTDRRILHKHTVTHDKKRQLPKPPQLLIKPVIRGDRWQDVRVCVSLRQLWLSYLLDVNLPRCCLLGFAEGGTVGPAFFCGCVFVYMCVWLTANQRFRERVFFNARVSVPACMCTCHVVPLSKRVHAVNLTPCLKAVGMERETKAICFKLKKLSRVHSSHTRSKPTPRLNKWKVSFYLLCVYSGSPTVSNVWETSTK